MIYHPHDYQIYTTAKIIKTPRILAVLEMGLGKTVSTLTAINYLMFDSMEIEKVLVIAPKKVADFTWQEEIEKWDHLRNISISKILGDKNKRIEGLNRQADIYTINRENVEWLIEYLLDNKMKWPFDCIVIDESSSFKNHNSKRFKALKKVAFIAKRIILLTGTPAPNSLLDLWPQMYLVDKGQRLEQSITRYRNSYFRADKMNRGIVYSYKILPGAEDIIYKKISDVSMSLKALDHLKMPERVDNFIKVKMDKQTHRLYKELEDEYILTLDENTITAASAGVVANKLLQMANGAVYDNDKNIITIHDLKLDALEEILEDNPGRSIMVFYNYQHDLERLKERFKKENPRELITSKDKKDWDNGSIRLLLAHPASMGHGLNLQAGGNIIVWFGLTWSLELYQQANARLYRQGQQEAVIINHIICCNTEDEIAMRRLKDKESSQEELIKAIKAKIKNLKLSAKNANK